MRARLRETAEELAGLLWREYIVYRDRSGEVVIRGEHVQRWISLAPAAGADEILVRAGRILDGGTTAPARSEAVVALSAGTSELAAACRRLLADTAAAPAPPAPGSAKSRRHATARSGRGSRRHTGLGSWVVIACVLGVLGFCAYRIVVP
ncbi:hypothetical protein [Streptomyces hiroshimensis]|uniref:Uncharacterized protein n=1 Tax=Streptomyces hiroshimensis TaxID=66424 RepID=A0ABQ2Z7Z4_9ACTN|nr:hypothetical protein [Streptomyces hiroshimensis]GGY07578.1 hypothetical protein GCM10010324_62980 [Streptomyces hiroshimensis]